MNRRGFLCAAAWAALSTVACAPAVPEVLWDVDNCEFCRMTISDRRFGAAAVTSGGRTVHFDSIECLAGWVNAQPEPPRSLWLSDASAPGVLRPLAEVRFHRTAAGRSPMGKGFVAVAAGAEDTTWDGQVLTWDEVRAAVSAEGMTDHAGHTP